MPGAEKVARPVTATTAISVPSKNVLPTASSLGPGHNANHLHFPPMYRHSVRKSVDLEDYFTGPRDIARHSKWPFFLRMHGSVLPKMLLPLLFLALWSTAIQCICEFVYPIGVSNVLLTVTGFVVGLALSFRSSTAYERYTEGRKYWSQLILTSRNLARIIWIHVHERHNESVELGRSDLLAKLAAMNLLNAFAVSLKHRLRFEPSVEYPDLQPLIAHLKTLAHEADQEDLREKDLSRWKAIGQYLGLPFAESNPRKLVKRAKDNLGNTPLEILTYLSAYFESVFQNKTLVVGCNQGQAMTLLGGLGEVLAGVERVVNTPLPIAYSISIAQITWAYVLVLPVQLVRLLGWVSIPGTILAGYVILGLAQIGHELENPFGQDVNDLPLDAYCHEIANDIDAMTSRPAPLKTEEWMAQAGAQVMWPLSSLEFNAWEARSVEEIRAALRAKAANKEAQLERIQTTLMTEGLTKS